MTLNLGKINRTYKIQQSNLPRNIEKRLEALGMTLGSTVDILNSKNKGTLIIKVRGTRFAIGKGISKKISVKEMKE
ncbi:FeoA family protein [Anaerovorax odorimutans]|uniref:FeoA family protein n=1 Tax=Anaerovorax odorimutans TaxID=109327 RepID=UPI000482B5A1|nr:FeoA domain-containing protein [Anaerovorax odorimutans]